MFTNKKTGLLALCTVPNSAEERLHPSKKHETLEPFKVKTGKKKTFFHLVFPSAVCDRRLPTHSQEGCAGTPQSQSLADRFYASLCTGVRCNEQTSVLE